MFNLEEEPEGLELTIFDRVRIANLEIGEKMDGECGKYSVARYSNEYLLLLENGKTKEFKTSTGIIQYLL